MISWIWGKSLWHYISIGYSYPLRPRVDNVYIIGMDRYIISVTCLIFYHIYYNLEMYSFGIYKKRYNESSGVIYIFLGLIVYTLTSYICILVP